MLPKTDFPNRNDAMDALSARTGWGKWFPTGDAIVLPLFLRYLPPIGWL
jgi:hypothetical protein